MNGQSIVAITIPRLPPRGRTSWGVWLLSLILSLYLTWQLHHLQIESVKFIEPTLFYLMEAMAFAGAIIAYGTFTGMTLWLDGKFRPYPVYSILTWMVLMLIFLSLGMRFHSPDMLDQAAMYMRVIEHPYEQNSKHLHLSQDGRTVVIDGMLDYGATAALKTLLDARPQITTINLRSHGGVAAEGIWMGKLIRTRGLDTRVDSYCVSACTFAFMGGVHRTATANASFGFHMPSILASDKEYAKIVAFMRYCLTQNGATYSFAQEAMNHKFRAPWYPAREQLVAGNVLTTQ